MDLEGTHKDHQSLTPDSAQDNSKNNIMYLGALHKNALNSSRLFCDTFRLWGDNPHSDDLTSEMPFVMNVFKPPLSIVTPSPSHLQS